MACLHSRTLMYNNLKCCFEHDESSCQRNKIKARFYLHCIEKRFAVLYICNAFVEWFALLCLCNALVEWFALLHLCNALVEWFALLYLCNAFVEWFALLYLCNALVECLHYCIYVMPLWNVCIIVFM